jgi:type-IV secretion system protein TraC
MKNSLADYLQVWGFEDDITIFREGSFGFGLAVTPTDCSCWSVEQANEFSNRVCQFLNGLPASIDIQFIQDIKGGNSKLIEKHGSEVANKDPIVSELTQARIAKLQNLDCAGHLPKHEMKIMVRRRPSSDLLAKPKFFAKVRDFEEITVSKLKHEIASTERLAEDIASGLVSLGLKVKRLTSHKVLEMLYQQWNPSRSVGLGNFDPDDVRYSLLFTDVGISERGFTMGNFHYRVISLKLLPDQTFANMAARLRELPFDSRLFLTVHVPDQQTELEALQTQRRIAYSMVAGKRTGVSDLESEAKFRDIETLLEQMVAQGEKVFHMSLQIVLKAITNEVLEERVSETLIKIRELGGSEGMEESLAAFDIFAEVAIPNSRSKERVKRIKTSNLCDLLPLFGPWEGHDQPKMLLRSRFGSLVSFNPFSSELANSNQIVSGGSGSGKSFMTNILLMQMLKDDPKIFIVDIGGSYKKICDNLNGQYIQLGVDSDLSINPFDLAPGEVKPSSQKIKFILSLVEIMTKEDSLARLGKLEKAEIEAAIEQVYANSKAPCLSDLREILIHHSELQIQKVGRILAPWCSPSPYGKFVDRSTTLELKRPIVCFDLKGMEKYPDLQAVCLFIITDFVWREVQGDRSRIKFLVLDECWKLMENDSASLFIAEVYRTFRKYLASAIAISQNIDDFARSKIATAILPNSSIKWVLKQKGADKDRLKEVLSLNPNEVDLINSLHQERGSYSEAFLMAEDQRAVVVIESTPLEYWLATTDARDLGKIDEFKMQHPEMNNLEVLKVLSEKYPRGFAVIGGNQ